MGTNPLTPTERESPIDQSVVGGNWYLRIRCVASSSSTLLVASFQSRRPAVGCHSVVGSSEWDLSTLRSSGVVVVWW